MNLSLLTSDSSLCGRSTAGGLTQTTTMAQRPSQTLSSGATLATLPPELVSLVLALGSRWGEAKGELLRYMLVCRAFKGAL